jgi:hypothetical protein
MKPNASPLNIIDFAISSLEFNLVAPQQGMQDINEYFKNYEVDIDFGVAVDELIRVFIKADVNRGSKVLPGYSFSAEASCFFQLIENEPISADIKTSLEGFSTIYIALNSLRGLISSFTANAPFGRYILPSVDLNDLIEKKKQILRGGLKANSEIKSKIKEPGKKAKKKQ